jgi:hypothetical protein
MNCQGFKICQKLIFIGTGITYNIGSAYRNKITNQVSRTLITELKTKDF